MKPQILNKLLIMGTAVISACSSTNNANWMDSNQEVLAKKLLTNLVIPGSHFANAYEITSTQNHVLCTGETLVDSMSINAQIAQLMFELYGKEESEFIKYLNTQDQNIYSQLSTGIRYLELQIC